MDWTSFITGLLSAGFAYALFSSHEEEDDEVIEYEEDEELEINDHSVRHVTLSCQTCRKLKRHREVERNLFQCTKCKRHVDLRKVS